MNAAGRAINPVEGAGLSGLGNRLGVAKEDQS